LNLKDGVHQLVASSGYLRVEYGALAICNDVLHSTFRWTPEVTIPSASDFERGDLSRFD
jgi:hypothetical protein